MAPRTQAADNLHAMKYRERNEDFKESQYRFSFGLKDDDEHYHQIKDITVNQRFLGGGRTQGSIGATRKTTAFNCLDGNEEILTLSGYSRLRSMVGQTVHVLSPASGIFVPAKIKSYGIQDIYRIILSNSRFGQERSGTFGVLATQNHRWILQSGEVTESLKPGDLLMAAACDVDSDDKGFVHGFIFGDGYKVRDSIAGLPRSNPEFTYDYPLKKFGVRFCGKKVDYLRRFESSKIRLRVSYPPSLGGEPYAVVFWDVELKELPRSEASPEYLKGFVEGLLAADACFKNRGNDPFTFFGNEATVKWMRDYLIYADYAPCGRPHEMMNETSNYGERNYPIWGQRFRRSTDHVGFKVLSVEYAKRDEVFCAEEPENHQIVLRNGLRTGNCFVSGTIPDSYTERDNDQKSSIMHRCDQAAATMRMGGGIGYDFSTIRPRGDLIRKLQSQATGPVNFMRIYNEVCLCTSSSGHRRGAQMGVLRVDHPDIEEFIGAKQDSASQAAIRKSLPHLPPLIRRETEIALQSFNSLVGFNISIAVTDEFMEAALGRKEFDLRFQGNVYRTVDAAELWEKIMRSTWDYAEPGVMFIDRMNEMNNLYYCETIAATNPCVVGETLIAVAGRGAIPIRQLAREKKDVPVFAVDPETSETVVRWGRKPRLTKKSVSVVKVMLDDGSFLRVTPDHRFPIRGRGKVMAKNLKPGDSLFRFDSTVTKQDGLVVNGRLEYHLVAEAKYGRKFDFGRLKGQFNVHHLDGDHFKNEWDNIEVEEVGEHSSLHKSGDGNPMRFWWKKQSKARKDAYRERMSIAAPGENNGMFGRKHSVETLRKIGDKMRERFRNGRFRKKHLDEVARSGTNHKVVSVDDDGTDDVYNITVDEHHNYAVVTSDGRSSRWNNKTMSGVYVQNCGEQPLPPFGACLLGSFCLPNYCVKNGEYEDGIREPYYFDWNQFREDIPAIVRAMDNINDRTRYPLAEQRAEALSKRRMGLGITGLANAAEACGHGPYGSIKFLEFEGKVLEVLRDETYRASVVLSKEKGPFPLFDAERYLEGKFVATLPEDVRNGIKEHGIRNSHLTSIAPTGTISMCADNVSSSIEPVFAYRTERPMNTPNGTMTEVLEDYGAAFMGVRGKLAGEVSAAEHVGVLTNAQRFVDSAVSKTVNMDGDKMEWNDFKGLYEQAFAGGAKGCTTFNVHGKRMALLSDAGKDEAVCSLDGETGRRECT